MTDLSITAVASETSRKFEPGQLAYSRANGACIYLTASHHAADPAQATCRILLIFSDRDDHEKRWRGQTSTPIRQSRDP